MEDLKRALSQEKVHSRIGRQWYVSKNLHRPWTTSKRIPNIQEISMFDLFSLIFHLCCLCHCQVNPPISVCIVRDIRINVEEYSSTADPNTSSIRTSRPIGLCR